MAAGERSTGDPLGVDAYPGTSSDAPSSPGDEGDPGDVVDTGEPTPEPTATAGSPRPGDRPAIPPSFAGTWSGHIKPTDPSGLLDLREHDVRIGLASGRDSGSWTEPTSRCSGTLVLTRVNGSVLSFDLKVDDPLECVAGTLTLTRRGDRLAYHWLDGLGAGTFYDGMLTRG